MGTDAAIDLNTNQGLLTPLPCPFPSHQEQDPSFPGRRNSYPINIGFWWGALIRESVPIWGLESVSALVPTSRLPIVTPEEEQNPHGTLLLGSQAPLSSDFQKHFLNSFNSWEKRKRRQ